MPMIATDGPVPKGAIIIDATAPIARVVDDILSKCIEAGHRPISPAPTAQPIVPLLRCSKSLIG